MNDDYMELNTYGKLLGGHPEYLCLCRFLKILMVSDKTMHKVFIIHKTF